MNNSKHRTASVVLFTLGESRRQGLTNSIGGINMPASKAIATISKEDAQLLASALASSGRSNQVTVQDFIKAVVANVKKHGALDRDLLAEEVGQARKTIDIKLAKLRKDINVQLAQK